MDVEFIWNYCLSKNGAEETFPFNPSTLVFKLGGKMFALFDVDNFNGINLKCNPERSINLRESYNGIVPAFHMNKKHWITVKINQDVDSDLLIELINHSYDLVYNSLPKKIRDGI
jgi:predicted DNA-binding protein (MmcQ/YjbR family)